MAFGYQKVKADKHKLEIDPVAGSVVQDIFKMKLQGMSQDAIANRLNELGVLSPLNIRLAAGVIMKPGSDERAGSLEFCYGTQNTGK